MADLINIRLTKDSPEVEVMDETAKALGISRNEMILRAVKMMVGFDKVFYKKLESYSEKMKVPMWTAMQNMIIKRWAQDAAKAAVWGSNPQILIEFSTTEDGVISAKELYEMVYQMTFNSEAKERVGSLNQELLNSGKIRNEEDKEFYEKYRPKYSTVEDEKTDSFAWWESEMTDEETIEKLKGGKSNDKNK